MVRAAFRADPTALAQFQSFVHIAALAAGLRAWGKAVYLYEVHSVPPALVLKHRKEHALAQFQSFVHIAALAAGLRAWGKAVYLYEVHSVPPALVLKHRKEHPEGSVSYGLRQVMVSLHTLYVQVLHAEGTHLAIVRECMGDFVEVILAAVSDVFLQPGYADACLVAVGRTFLFTAQPLLQQSQAVQAVLQVLRVVKRASVRAYGE